MRFASATNYPQGTAWATHAALTKVLTAPQKRFGQYRGFGLYPNDPSAAALALTAPSADSVATAASWAVFAGVLGFAGFVGYQAVWGKK